MVVLQYILYSNKYKDVLQLFKIEYFHSQVSLGRITASLDNAAAREITTCARQNKNIDADRVINVLYQEVINRCFAKRVDFPTKLADKDGLKELLCDSLPELIKKEGSLHTLKSVPQFSIGVN